MSIRDLASSNVARAADVFSVAIFFSSSRAPRRSLARVWRAESASAMAVCNARLQVIAGDLAEQCPSLYELTLFHVTRILEHHQPQLHLSGFGGALNPAWRGEYYSRARVIGGYSVSLHRVAVSSKFRRAPHQWRLEEPPEPPSIHLCLAVINFLSSCFNLAITQRDGAVGEILASADHGSRQQQFSHAH